MTNAIAINTFCGLDCAVPTLHGIERQAWVVLTKSVRNTLNLDLANYGNDPQMKREDVASLLPSGVDSCSEAEAAPMIREADFYRAVLGSDNPAAHPFRHWLTVSVLPTIKADGIFLYGEDAAQSVSTDALVPDLDPHRPENEGVLSHLFDRVLPVIRTTGAYVGHLVDDQGHSPTFSIDVVAAIRNKTERQRGL